MNVQNVMKTNVITIAPNTSIEKAISMMKTYKIRHLPVVDSESHLVGLVSDRDLRDASPSVFAAKSSMDITDTVDTIMSTNLVTGTPLDFVEDVATLLYEFKIGCMPILQNNKLVGIVTQSDLLYTFVQITGTNMPSSRFELKIPDRPGILSRVSAVFQRNSVNIISVLLYPSEEETHKKIVIRAGVMNTDTLVEELSKEGFEVLWPQKL